MTFRTRIIAALRLIAIAALASAVIAGSAWVGLRMQPRILNTAEVHVQPREAIFTEASAQAAIQQTRIAAWQLALSFATTVAAITAALLAWKANSQNANNERPLVALGDTIKIFEDRVARDRVKQLLGVRFANHGRSPAELVSYRLDTGWFYAPPSVREIDGAWEPLPALSIIPTDGHWPLNHHLVSATMDADWRRFVAEGRLTIPDGYVDGGENLYLFGHVIYKDMDGHQYETWFSRIFNGRNFVFGIGKENTFFRDKRFNGRT